MNQTDSADIYESIRYVTVMLKAETNIPPIVLEALRQLNSVVAANCRKGLHECIK